MLEQQSIMQQCPDCELKLDCPCLFTAYLHLIVTHWPRQWLSVLRRDAALAEYDGNVIMTENEQSNETKLWKTDAAAEDLAEYLMPMPTEERVSRNHQSHFERDQCITLLLTRPCCYAVRDYWRLQSSKSLRLQSQGRNVTAFAEVPAKQFNSRIYVLGRR